MSAPAVRSLTARVILLSSVWAIVAFAVAGGLISTLYERTARKGFEDLLTAQLYNLVNSVSVGDSGYLSGSPDLGDLRYLQPSTASNCGSSRPRSCSTARTMRRGSG